MQNANNLNNKFVNTNISIFMLLRP